MRKTPLVALFLQHPKCSIDSGNGIIRSLRKYYNFKIFTYDTLSDNFFDDVDLIAVPGGIGDADYFSRSFRNNKTPIENYINRGGHYLGICMGAYWADKYYFNLLKDVRVVQYIKQPNTDTKRPHAKACDIYWNKQPDKMYFYDGCAFTGNGKFNTIASYANGDPMAIMQNRIGLIGCHPESDRDWYDKPYLERYWHDYRHDQLLLDFTNDLIKR